jgi:hypothetical protein
MKIAASADTWELGNCARREFATPFCTVVDPRLTTALNRAAMNLAMGELDESVV